MPSSPSPVLDEIRTLPQRGARRSASASVPKPPPALSIRIPVRVAGMLLLVLVVVGLASIASWSVDDPSLSFATSKPAANWLGYPGAVMTEILFQVLGL